jgi:glycosyltransferase involved in cell wall biosynthesis
MTRQSATAAECARRDLIMSTLSRFHFVQAGDALARAGREVSLRTADPRARPTLARVVRPTAPVLLGYAAHRKVPARSVERWLIRRFDAEVAGALARSGPSAFHGGSLHCLESLRTAQRMGTPCVVERSGAHIEDGFGMVVGEAMASGCPVIVTKNVWAKDMVDEGVDGFVVDIRNPEQVAEKLTLLRDHPDALQEMSRKALEKARQFTWDRYAMAVSAMWRDLGAEQK